MNYSIILGILLTGKLNFTIIWSFTYYSSLIVHVYMYIVYTFVDNEYHTRQFIGENWFVEKRLADFIFVI